MKICILYGGVSSEREVSLNTGKSIYDAICDDYDIVMHDWDGNYESMYNVAKEVDLVFIALHGGDGEDGTIQKYLESKNIKFTGSSSIASEKAMDKNVSKTLCVENDIPTPDWIVSHKRDNINLTLFSTTFSPNDIVIKPNNEGSSIGISIIFKNVEEYLYGFKDRTREAVKKVFEISDSVIMELFIDGRELTVSILNDRVLPIVEIIPRGDYYDYKCKYTKFQSDYVVPAEIDKKTQELLSAYSLKIHKLIGCGAYSRVDFRLSKEGEIYFLEINTLPGFTGTSLFPKAAEAYGLDYRELIKKIIEIT